jgi:hypothetical protein
MTRFPAFIVCTSLSVLVCIATVQQSRAAAFSPPAQTVLSYRYSRTATVQSAESYEAGMIAYTIRLSVVDQNERRTVCSFVIDSLTRMGPGLTDTTVFPGRGKVIFSRSGSVVDATIDEYLIQPSFEEQSSFLSNGFSDREIFSQTTFFSIPTFADASLAPGDTIIFPRKPEPDEDGNLERTSTFRLADTTFLGQKVTVFGKTKLEENSTVYDQPYYTYHKNDDTKSEEKLWWNDALHTAFLYESVREEFSIVGVTGQLQMVNNNYLENVVRIELLGL